MNRNRFCTPVSCLTLEFRLFLSVRLTRDPKSAPCHMRCKHCPVRVGLTGHRGVARGAASLQCRSCASIKRQMHAVASCTSAKQSEDTNSVNDRGTWPFDAQEHKDVTVRCARARRTCSQTDRALAQEISTLVVDFQSNLHRAFAVHSTALLTHATMSIQGSQWAPQASVEWLRSWADDAGQLERSSGRVPEPAHPLLLPISLLRRPRSSPCGALAHLPSPPWERPLANRANDHARGCYIARASRNKLRSDIRVRSSKPPTRMSAGSRRSPGPATCDVGPDSRSHRPWSQAPRTRPLTHEHTQTQITATTHTARLVRDLSPRRSTRAQACSALQRSAIHGGPPTATGACTPPPVRRSLPPPPHVRPSRTPHHPRRPNVCVEPCARRTPARLDAARAGSRGHGRRVAVAPCAKSAHACALSVRGMRRCIATAYAEATV